MSQLNKTPIRLEVGDKRLTITKWKGKNKKEFTRLLNDPKVNEQGMMNSLVYSCIEEDVILSLDEFRYVLSRIRALSLGNELEFNFICDKCKETFTTSLKIDEIIRCSYIPLKEINEDEIKIKLGPIRNREVYSKKIEEDPIYDFLLRIESINGNDTFTLSELEEMFDEIELDTLEKIMGIYESHRFKVDDVNDVQCECGHTMKFKFDELPGFFPDNWFE